ncbi:MAG: hypothetical protein J0L82_05565 [Deltaproteobacteria bacterium]|nr:hypothetical protein [Deltaproteobacteria bacterium]
MKVLALIWGWIVFTPILAPIFALPVLFVVGKILRFALRRVNNAIIFILLCLALGAITYFNAQKGQQAYFDFLGSRGVETTATVINVLKQSNLFGNESPVIVTVEFQNHAGKPHTVAVSLSEPRLYPYGEKLNLVPELGDDVRIRYFPDVESGLMINTNPKLSAFGQKVECLRLKSDLKTAQLRLENFVAKDHPSVQAYKTIIQRLLDSTCLSLNDRNYCRGVLSNLE